MNPLPLLLGCLNKEQEICSKLLDQLGSIIEASRDASGEEYISFTGESGRNRTMYLLQFLADSGVLKISKNTGSNTYILSKVTNGN